MLLSGQKQVASSRTVARAAYVLDDEPQIAEVVCRMLEAIGFEPRKFGQPLPFLVQAKSVPPDVVIVDLSLGRADAVEVIRQLEIIGYRGRVLLITGHDAEILGKIKDIGKSHGLAMLPPLVKPFGIAELKASLAAAPEVAQAKQPAVQAARTARVDLKAVLEKGSLELWYQPKIDLRSLAPCGAEALLRARDAGVILSPADLLPARGDPLFEPLTAFVIKQALLDWQRFAEQKMYLRLAVNIPVSLARAVYFVKSMLEFVPRTHLFPGIIFEITEAEMLEDIEGFRELATQLQLYGVRVAIDDFGAGYLSLARLRDLPCIEVKLDGRFTSDCSQDEAKRLLCKAAIDVAHSCGMSVCAEAVETVNDLRALIGLQCDMAQGFLFARPMPAEQLIQHLGNPPRQPKSPQSDAPGPIVREAGASA